MKKLHLFNLSHDFAATTAEDKPIFLPFGKWAYDEKVSQSLDREHAERIANELNARVGRGEPGIPVYQGHPDVPQLAPKYPDKGALGWIERMELTNEGVNLFVNWDRFPGKGFKWFSPYWLGEPTGLDNEGKTHVAVDTLVSVGLVNNPNISEFRLPNEQRDQGSGIREQKGKTPMKNQKLIYELANEYDESKHPRAEDGKWTDGAGGGSVKDWHGGATDTKGRPSRVSAAEAIRKHLTGTEKLSQFSPEFHKRFNQEFNAWDKKFRGSSSGGAKSTPDSFNAALKKAKSERNGAAIAKAHMDALKAGFVWSSSKKEYTVSRFAK